MYLCFSGALKASIFDTFWNKIRRFLCNFWHLGSCMPKEVSRYPHDCCRMAYLSLSGPNMNPSWLQVGFMLAPCWPQLHSSWAHVGPGSGPPAAPEPTQALPNPFPVASEPPKPPFVPYKIQHRPQKATPTSNLDLQDPRLGSQNTPTWLQKAPSQAPNPAAQARRRGRSLFILRRTPVRSASVL